MIGLNKILKYVHKVGNLGNIWDKTMLVIINILNQFSFRSKD